MSPRELLYSQILEASPDPEAWHDGPAGTRWRKIDEHTAEIGIAVEIEPIEVAVVPIVFATGDGE